MTFLMVTDMTPKETNEALYWAEKLTFSEKKEAILEAKKKKYFETKHAHKWPKDPYENDRTTTLVPGINGNEAHS